MSRILVEEGRKTRVVELGSKERITIGRAESCGLVVGDKAASREHCALERRGHDWWIADLKSKNGTKLNGGPVAEAALAPGDRVEIGLARITFLGDGVSATDDTADESSGLQSFARSLGVGGKQAYDTVPVPPRRDPCELAADAAIAAVGEGRGLTAVLDAIEKVVLSRALAEAKENRSEAARRLGLSRPGLLKKMKRHGLR